MLRWAQHILIHEIPVAQMAPDPLTLVFTL